MGARGRGQRVVRNATVDVLGYWRQRVEKNEHRGRIFAEEAVASEKNNSICQN